MSAGKAFGGEVEGIEITQGFLFAASAYIAVASVMIFLSLVLRPGINRWMNIVLPILYVVSIVVSAIGESWTYFIFLISLNRTGSWPQFSSTMLFFLST